MLDNNSTPSITATVQQPAAFVHVGTLVSFQDVLITNNSSLNETFTNPGQDPPAICQHGSSDRLSRRLE
jgi:hypothetical protein